MKTTKTLLLGAVATVALAANQSILAADFSPSDLSNRAIAASPRAKEQFPWLTRKASAQTETTPRAFDVPAAVKNNRALASSPRMREQYPQLVLGEPPATLALSKPNTGNRELDKVMKNRALARSPRILEQFPELAREYTAQSADKSIEIAPLK